MSKQRVWVLLRSLSREQRHWGNFPAVLQSYLPDDKIILHDFPGNGQRHNEKSALSIHEMVNDVRSFILELETHNTAGHDIPLDNAEWVCERIIVWLKSV